MSKVAALLEYIDLQSRARHPGGSFDKQGRWYPSDSERQECCQNMRTPSTSYPLSLNQHCRTLKHVATKHGYHTTDLSKLRKQIENTTLDTAALSELLESMDGSSENRVRLILSIYSQFYDCSRKGNSLKIRFANGRLKDNFEFSVSDLSDITQVVEAIIAALIFRRIARQGTGLEMCLAC